MEIGQIDFESAASASSAIPGRHLYQLESEVAKLSDDDLDRGWRKSFAQGMNNRLFDIGSIMMVHQPDFEWDVTRPKGK
jgi:hypothetical protein